MALEGILEKLSVEKDGEFKASDKYDSQVLYGSSEGLDELDKTNLESKEGLAKYKTLTGDDPTKYSQRKLTSRKDMRLRGGREDFGAYVDTNFTEMIKKDVDEQVQVQIAYKYCPTKDVSDKDAKPYNEKRKIVSDTKETIKKINETPDDYIKEEIEKETPLMARYIARYTEEFLEIEQMEAQESALNAIQDYKPIKFITDTKKYLGNETEGLAKEEAKIRKTIEDKLQSARGLSSEARAKLISKEYEQLQKLNEKYVDAELGKRLTQETVAHAIGAIKGKYETAPDIYDILKQYPDAKAPTRNERTSNTPTRQSNENLEERTESSEPTRQERPQENQDENESNNQEQENTSETQEQNYQAPNNTEEQSQPSEQARPQRNT